MTNSRKLVYALLLAPIFLASLYLLSMDSQSRGSFLGVYAETAQRIATGDWSFSELIGPAKPPRSEMPQRRYRNGVSPLAVFQKLDRDQDGQLSTKEMGQRLTRQILGTEVYAGALGDAFGGVTAEQFTKAVQVYAPSDAIPGKTPPQQTTQTPGLSAERLFDPSRVLTVDIEIDSASWNQLCQQSRNHRSAAADPLNKPYTNFRADIIVDGVKIPSVAIRKKGFIGSQDTVRPSLKIKFDEYVQQSPVQGLDRLTLNNNKQDRGLISQTLTYQLFRKAGIPAPRTSFASVSVNGKHLGVYTHVESVRKPFLRHVFGDDSGKLYEGTLTDLYPPAIERIEAKIKVAENRDGILRVATLLDEELSTLEDIAGVVDIDSFLRYWCIESLINFWDGYTQNQNNYFIYERPDSGLISFMPWGADSCFAQQRPHFVQRDGIGTESVRATSILAHRLYHYPGIAEEYRTVMLEILEDVWNEDELVGEVNRIGELLHDELDARQCATILGRDAVINFIRQRRQIMVNELEQWPAEVTSAARIPRHDVEIGTGSAKFRWQGDQFTVTGTVDLEEGQTEIQSFRFEEGELVMTAQFQQEPFEIRFQLAPPKPQQDPAQDTQAPAIALEGTLSNSRQGVRLQGELQVDSYLEAEPKIRAGELNFSITETRGGR